MVAYLSIGGASSFIGIICVSLSAYYLCYPSDFQSVHYDVTNARMYDKCEVENVNLYLSCYASQFTMDLDWKMDGIQVKIQDYVYRETFSSNLTKVLKDVKKHKTGTKGTGYIVLNGTIPYVTTYDIEFNDECGASIITDISTESSNEIESNDDIIESVLEDTPNEIVITNGGNFCIIKSFDWTVMIRTMWIIVLSIGCVVFIVGFNMLMYAYYQSKKR